MEREGGEAGRRVRGREEKRQEEGEGEGGGGRQGERRKGGERESGGGRERERRWEREERERERGTRITKVMIGSAQLLPCWTEPLGLWGQRG